MLSTTFTSALHVPLPVAGEINALAAPERDPSNAPRLIAIGNAAVVLTPRGLLRVAKQVETGDVVVAHIVTSETAEIALSMAGVGAIQAVGRLVVDALHVTEVHVGSARRA